VAGETDTTTGTGRFCRDRHHRRHGTLRALRASLGW
jgi:hypothetical protein